MPGIGTFGGGSLGPEQSLDTLGLGLGATRPSLRDLSVGIRAGGLISSVDTSPGLVRVRSTAERQALVDQLAGSFRTRAGEVSQLRRLVSPGFSAFRQAGLRELETRSERGISNLRENLARRRVAGSSFAQDALARAEAEFGQEAATFAAGATLQEIDSFLQLTTLLGQLEQASFQTQLNELNLQADVALALAGRGAQALSAASQLQQQAAMQSVRIASSFGAFGAAGGFGATPMSPTTAASLSASQNVNTGPSGVP